MPVSLLLATLAAMQGGHDEWISLPPGPIPVENPLKGYAAYLDATPKLSGYASMAYVEAPWSRLEPLEHQYRFGLLDQLFERPLSKGKSIVLRIWLDYPSRPSGVPKWLIDKGVRMTPYSDYGGGLSPDYDNPVLTKSLGEFIRALGIRYRDSNRVRFVEMGLLGYWGEWHTYPHDNLFASQATQRLVVDEMHKAFPRTPLLGRYPDPALNVPWVGYHDDMLPDDTNSGPNWNFLPKLTAAHREDNWKSAPIGGEMVPFNAKRLLSTDWDKLIGAVKVGHFSFIAGYCPVLEQNVSAEFRQRSDELERLLGYTFRFSRAKLATQVSRGGDWNYDIEGVNIGVAPFYYAWPVKLALLRGDGSVAEQIRLPDDIRTWLPGKVELKGSVKWHAPAGEYRLGIGVFDPGGLKPDMTFANELPVVDGWTVLRRKVRVAG